MPKKRRVTRQKIHEHNLALAQREEAKREKRAEKTKKRKQKDDPILDYEMDVDIMSPAKRRKLVETMDDDRVIDISGPPIARARDVEIPVIETPAHNSVIIHFGHSEDDARAHKEATMKQTTKEKLDLAKDAVEREAQKELEQANKMDM